MENRTTKLNHTIKNPSDTKEIIFKVYEALLDKGYNPINQLVGYFMSGDPTYITSHQQARNLIRQVEREEILEVLLKYYLNTQE